MAMAAHQGQVGVSVDLGSEDVSPRLLKRLTPGIRTSASSATAEGVGAGGV